MRSIIILAAVAGFLSSCNDKTGAAQNNYKSLSATKINTVGMLDTMVIHEKLCRGCPAENTTDFDIRDTGNVVELFSIKTTDDHSGKEDSNHISKEIILIPLKKGSTTFKFFKTAPGISQSPGAPAFTAYKVEVK